MEGNFWRPSGCPAACLIILHKSDFCFNCWDSKEATRLYLGTAASDFLKSPNQLQRGVPLGGNMGQRSPLIAGWYGRRRVTRPFKLVFRQSPKKPSRKPCFGTLSRFFPGRITYLMNAYRG
jgi:hypothetical protein